MRGRVGWLARSSRSDLGGWFLGHLAAAPGLAWPCLASPRLASRLWWVSLRARGGSRFAVVVGLASRSWWVSLRGHGGSRFALAVGLASRLWWVSLRGHGGPSLALAVGLASRWCLDSPRGCGVLAGLSGRLVSWRASLGFRGGAAPVCPSSLSPAWPPDRCGPPQPCVPCSGRTYRHDPSGRDPTAGRRRTGRTTTARPAVPRPPMDSSRVCPPPKAPLGLLPTSREGGASVRSLPRGLRRLASLPRMAFPNSGMAPYEADSAAELWTGGWERFLRGVEEAEGGQAPGGVAGGSRNVRR